MTQKIFDSMHEKQIDLAKRHGKPLPAESIAADQLKLLLSKNEVKSILDIGCGNLDWLELVEGIDKVNYYGVDISSVIIDHNRQSIPWFNGEQADVSKVGWKPPEKSYDLVIVKDVLQYMTNPAVMDFLENLRAVSYKYSFWVQDYEVNNFDRLPFPPESSKINLRVSPFSFKSPDAILPRRDHSRYVIYNGGKPYR